MKSLLISLSLLITISSSIFSQTEYTWNGSVNSGFSTAGNWTPFRQIMYATDILHINKGGNVNITSVNQITVGQLIISNNTHVTMTPNTGNARVLSIQGSEGDDFVIESGSSLNITGNDPKLSIYVKSGANAVISGELTLTGTMAHSIYSQDSLAIVFTKGSVFTQDSQGYAFSNAGSQNNVVFEDGSTFIINNVYASSPFGLTWPASKVKFLHGSSLIMATSNQLIQLGGRLLSNLMLQENISIIINDSAGFSFDSIYVPASSSLRFSNTNSSALPEISLKGNLNIDGTVSFGEPAGNGYNVNFNGSSLQTISGTGSILFAGNGKVTINNDIKLKRNISVNSSVYHLNGTVSSNGFTFSVNGRFNNLVLENSSSKPVTQGNTELNAGNPSAFGLSQNYPNPFNAQTIIEFSIPADSKVTMNMYDVSGKLVSEIMNKEMNAGSHKISFDSKNISSGVYFYTINTAGFNKTMKMIVVK